MTVAAKPNFQNKVFMDPAPTAATTVVAELISIQPPGMSRNTDDATTHDSAGGAMEFIADGIYDPGSMSLRMKYIAGSTNDAAFTTAMTGGALQNVKVHVKTAAGFQAWTFSGYVTAYEIGDMPITGQQECTLTLKVSGAVTKAPVTP